MSSSQIMHRSRYAHSGSYRSLDRWSSYWHQIDLVRAFKPTSLLEVGIGEGVVAAYLQESGIAVKTLDIDGSLGPDVVGDVRSIPLPDGAVEVALAAEILEHIPFTDVPAALAELRRVVTRGAVISAPAPGYVFSIRFKLPLLKKHEGIAKLPFFWKHYRYDEKADGVHYWELGYKEYPRRRLDAVIREAGFAIAGSYSYQDDPSHLFYRLDVR